MEVLADGSPTGSTGVRTESTSSLLVADMPEACSKCVHVGRSWDSCPEYSPSATLLQEEVLAGHRELLGPRHPDTLASDHNLAATLQSQGDLAGARALQEEVLAARRELLGPRHPDTTMSVWNLYLMLQKLDFEAARRLFD